MKNLSLLFLAVFSLNSAAQTAALQIKDLLGTYDVVSSIEGTCRPVIEVVPANLNSEGPAMAIYTTDQNDADHVIFQFYSLNAGRKVTLQENPMSGLPSDWFVSEHKLHGEKLTGETKVLRLFGITIWRDTISATLRNDRLEYITTGYNTISSPIVQKKNHCIYRVRK